MNEIKSEMISRRRALSLLGLATFLAVPATGLTVSDAEAQAGTPPSDSSVNGPDDRNRAASGAAHTPREPTCGAT